MAGEVLECAENPEFVMGPDELGGMQRDDFRIGGEAAIKGADDWIARVHIDVDDRCEVQVDAGVCECGSDSDCRSVGGGRVAYGTQLGG